ncbi:NFYB/HAP3 family transcription factor subunit [Candidatus Woesearchaeota archaeon]|nr:NFYB/HAP3 family transcription factor subunit [Candidatus Woesearchaeota archaeon]
MVSKKLLPLAAMEKILKKMGAERVSDKSKAALKHAVEGIAEDIAVKAVKFAHHAGRKTIKEGDINLAYNR